MKAILLPKYSTNVLRAILNLRVVEREIPKPAGDEVLVKLHAAAVNPSDIAFIQGGYNIVKTLPAIPGFEASGTVMDAGDRSKNLIGRKVSCFIQEDAGGTWSEYFVTKTGNLILLDDKMDMDQAACFTVNPFTAFALMNIALQRESCAIIQNAAGGQVPAFIRAMAKAQGKEVINIVRKKETADKLTAEGNKYVLVEQDEKFEEKLHNLAASLRATTALDAVGGAMSGLIFNAMPNDSELVVYGGLSGKPISGVHVMGLIFKDKIISGFNLVDWKNEIEEEDFLSISLSLQQKFIYGELKTNIRGRANFEDIAKGLKNYISNMSQGKILIKP